MGAPLDPPTIIGLTPRTPREEQSIETYGVSNIEAWGQKMAAEFKDNPARLPMEIMDLIATAQAEISPRNREAHQALNRARFLITRLCPILDEIKDPGCTSACGCST